MGELRDTGMNTNPLFIPHCKPHKPVTSSTIARWLKEIMKEARIDTSIFKAHSCRGAAVSAAKNHGLAVADVMKITDWSQETTFTRYYYRADKEDHLGQTVLRQKIHIIMYYTTSNIHCYMRSLL